MKVQLVDAERQGWEGCCIRYWPVSSGKQMLLQTHTHISRFALEVIEKNYRKMREIMKTATAADDAPHFLTFRRFSYENRSSSEMEW